MYRSGRVGNARSCMIRPGSGRLTNNTASSMTAAQYALVMVMYSKGRTLCVYEFDLWPMPQSLVKVSKHIAQNLQQTSSGDPDEFQGVH